MTLEEAQRAKVDLSLGKLGLQPGMTLLDIGCGWGSTIMRAVEKYDVNVIGLTLSENQKQHIEDHWFANSTSKRHMEVRLQPWEDFDEPVDRVVSIGAFEHFGFNKYDDYFKKTFNLMPDDGVMMLHTIIIPSDEEIKERQLPLTMSRCGSSSSSWTRSIPVVVCRWARRSKSTRPRRVHGNPQTAAASALRPHPGHLGRQSRIEEGRGHRHHVRTDLRTLFEVPDRLRRPVPRGFHRRLSIHLRKGSRLAESDEIRYKLRSATAQSGDLSISTGRGQSHDGQRVR